MYTCRPWNKDHDYSVNTTISQSETLNEEHDCSVNTTILYHRIPRENDRKENMIEERKSYQVERTASRKATIQKPRAPLQPSSQASFKVDKRKYDKKGSRTKDVSQTSSKAQARKNKNIPKRKESVLPPREISLQVRQRLYGQGKDKSKELEIKRDKGNKSNRIKNGPSIQVGHRLYNEAMKRKERLQVLEKSSKVINETIGIKRSPPIQASHRLYNEAMKRKERLQALELSRFPSKISPRDK